MDAILLAAGRSSRMGAGVEKQLARIGGKPAVLFSIEALQGHPAIERIILTHPAESGERMQALLDDYKVRNVELCTGGSSRQESVYLALQKVTSPRVLVHEAARPLISKALIERVVSADAPAVVPTWEVPFTVVQGSDKMDSELDRDTLRDVQLPQAFDTEILKDAHEHARASGETATEDSILVFRRGKEVRFVEGLSYNIKITYPADLAITEQLIFKYLN